MLLLIYRLFTIKYRFSRIENVYPRKYATKKKIISVYLLQLCSDIVNSFQQLAFQLFWILIEWYTELNIFLA